MVQGRVTAQSPAPCLYRGACLCPPLGNKQAPGSSTAPGAWHSLLATALPGVAFGHFISLFGLVTHSAQTSGKKRQHQKQSPIGKTQGRASATEGREQHLCHSPSAPQTLPTVSQVPFPNAGKFQREGSPEGFQGRKLLRPQLQPPKEPHSLLLSLPYVQVLPPEHYKQRTGTPNTQQASTEPPPEGRASVVRTIWAAQAALPSCLPSAFLSKYI